MSKVVFLDTSGSVNAEVVDMVLATHVGDHLFCFDGKLHDCGTISATTEVKGGGATVFPVAAIAAASLEGEVHIYTDGYIHSTPAGVDGLDLDASNIQLHLFTDDHGISVDDNHLNNLLFQTFGEKILVDAFNA